MYVIHLNAPIIEGLGMVKPKMLLVRKPPDVKRVEMYSPV